MLNNFLVRLSCVFDLCTWKIFVKKKIVLYFFEFQLDKSMTSNESILSASSSESSLLTLESILLVILLTAIIIGATVANILICLAFCIVRNLRTPHYYLMVSLAVTDLCVAILVCV